MIGKAEWFSPRKFGWGLGIKSWQGIAYIVVAAAVIGALMALPIDANLKLGLYCLIVLALGADVLHIMFEVYSKLDEREKKHQLIAERNASFTAIAVAIAYLLFFAISVPKAQIIPEAMIFPIALLLLMSVVKGATLLYLEREG